MLKNLLFIVSILIMVATPAFGAILRIDPNDDTVIWVGMTDTNFDASSGYGRLFIQNDSRGHGLLEFDIPAGVNPGDISLHLYGGFDYGTGPTGTQTQGLMFGLHDFDETVETWNTASWLPGDINNSVAAKYVMDFDNDPWQEVVFPIPEVATLYPSGGRVTFWLNGDSAANPNARKWSVFEDKEDSVYLATGTSYVPGPGYGPYIEIIPEPSAVMLLLLGAVPMLRRRRA